MAERTSTLPSFSEFASTLFDPAKYFPATYLPASYFKAGPMVPPDARAFMDLPRQNMNAMSAAVQSLNRGLERMLYQQTQLTLSMLEQSGKLGEAFRDGDSSANVASKQTEILRQSFDDTVEQMKQIVDTSARMQSEVLDAMRNSVDSGLAETRGQLNETGAGAPDGTGAQSSAGESRSRKAGVRSAKAGSGSQSEAE